MYSDRVPAALFLLSGNEICYPKEAHAQGNISHTITSERQSHLKPKDLCGDKLTVH